MDVSRLLSTVESMLNNELYNKWVDRNNGNDPTSLAIKQQNMLKDQYNQDRMLKERMFKDNLSAQRNLAELANPMSNLSASERYLATMQNLNTSQQSALADLQKKQFELGVSNETRDSLIDSMDQRANNERLKNKQLQQEVIAARNMNNLMGTGNNLEKAYFGSRGIATPTPQVEIPNTPAISHSATNPMTASPSTTTPALPKYSQPYTDAYMNYSNSPAGKMFSLPSVNWLFQKSIYPSGDTIGNIASGISNYLTTPKINNYDRF